MTEIRVGLEIMLFRQGQQRVHGEARGHNVAAAALQRRPEEKSAGDRCSVTQFGRSAICFSA